MIGRLSNNKAWEYNSGKEKKRKKNPCIMFGVILFSEMYTLQLIVQAIY